MTGILFDIRRYTVHDGPGIRTTVFFKGCPLQCRWCHNPESRSAGIQSITTVRKLDNHIHEYRETIGQAVTTEELMREILKDRVFYEESGGGVTFSGGEPLMQAEFLTDTLKACRSENIHTAVDTCGYAPSGSLSAVAAVADLFLYDLKLMDASDHLKYCGASNEIILNNLAMIAFNKKPVIIRLPVLPGINDSPENIRAMIKFLDAIPFTERKLSLLPYHDSAKNKYKKYNMAFTVDTLREPSDDTLQKLKQQFESIGFIVTIGT